MVMNSSQPQQPQQAPQNNQQASASGVQQPPKVSFFDKLLGRNKPQEATNDNGQPSQDTQGSQDTPQLTLDDFSQILQDAQNAQASNPAQPQQAISAALQNPDTINKIVEASGIKQTITPEMTQAFLSGNVQQIESSLQNLATNLFTKALHQATLLGEINLKQQLGGLQDSVQDNVRKQVIDIQLASNNPALQHPAVKAAVGSFKDAIIAANPNITPSQLDQALQAYTSELAAAFNPQNQQQSPEDSQANAGMDWEKYLS